MVPLFFLGIALLIGGILLTRWYVSASPASLVRALRWVLFSVVLAIAIGLLVTGKLGYALIALIGMIPAIARWFQVYRTTRSFMRGGRASEGRKSRVETAMLAMTLDHDSGGLAGYVLRGSYAGRALSELSEEDLLALLEECRRDDPQGAALLESWLDRNRGPDWRGGDAEGTRREAGRPPGGAMDAEEACRVLGLEPGASEAEIKRAHRALIARFHPDQGGSDYLAAKINQAKDVLLRRPG
ncbi:MAG: DnaJ domain-containing protein [Acetobacterales bacterium]